MCSRFCDTEKSASFIGIEKDDEIVLVNGTEYGKNKLLCTSVDRFDPEGKRPIVFSDIEQLKCEEEDFKMPIGCHDPWEKVIDSSINEKMFQVLPNVDESLIVADREVQIEDEQSYYFFSANGAGTSSLVVIADGYHNIQLFTENPYSAFKNLCPAWQFGQFWTF